MLCDNLESVNGPQETVTCDDLSWPGQLLSSCLYLHSLHIASPPPPLRLGRLRAVSSSAGPEVSDT